MSYEIPKDQYLTPLDKRLIQASIENDLSDVSTKRKRLEILSTDETGTVKAFLWSFEPGIGIGSPSRWKKQTIFFKSS